MPQEMSSRVDLPLTLPCAIYEKNKSAPASEDFVLRFPTRQQLTNLTISQLHLVTAASSSVADIVSTASSHLRQSANYVSPHLCCLPNRLLSATPTVDYPSVTNAGFDTRRALVQAFVSCRLDYCNSLLAGVADVHLRRLQSVQDAAARLVSGARRHDHITPILATLHWLMSVRERRRRWCESVCTT